MTVKRMVLMMFALLSIVLVIVALQGVVSGAWETIAGSVALVIGMIGILGVVIGFMVDR